MENPLFFHDLETPRLRLRNVSREDADFFFRQFSDPAVCRYLYDEEPFTEVKQAEELIDFFCREEPRNQHRWVVIRKEDGVRMGTCGFHHWNRVERTVETGYDLREEYWGKGYMTEAMKRIIRFAVENMDLSSIYADIYVGNQSSISLAERLGFARTGTMSFEFRGESMPHYIYTFHCKGENGAYAER